MDYRKEESHYFIRLERGEDLFSSLEELARSEGIKSGSVSGIGALEEVELGFFHLEEKRYHKKSFPHEMELISLNGNVSMLESRPFFHLHCTLGDEEYRCFGGHLFKAKIAVTCEIHLQAFSFSMKRKRNSEIGLNLISFEE